MITNILLQIIADDTIIKSGAEILQKTAGKIGFRLLIDFFSILILLRVIYYRIYRRSDLLFTYFIFNLTIFFICFLLNKVELSMGAAFGLFAVFSMLRYRTEGISIKDMTYLFLVIAIGLMSAVTKIKDLSDIYEYLFIIMVNATLLLITYFLESKIFFKSESTKVVFYERIELIHADKHEELIADLKNRTGIPINRVEVVKIDFLKDAALLKIYYFEH